MAFRWLFILYCCVGEVVATVITTAPIFTSVNFTCEGTGDRFLWIVESVPLTDAIKQQRDISVTDSHSGSNLSSVLTITALPVNDNIGIGCAIFSFNPYNEVFAVSDTLKVRGVSPVEDLHVDFTSNNSLNLTWSPPVFLSDDVPISATVNYRVIIVTSGTGEPIVDTTVSTPSITVANITECDTFNVSVTVSVAQYTSVSNSIGNNGNPYHTVTSTVNCTGVYLNWSSPYTLPNCPIHYYTLSVNNRPIGITNDSYYQLTNLLPNGHYTISITANGSSIGRNSSFITAIGPYVTVVSNTISLIPHSSVNASLNITAQVTDSNCLFSFPSQLSINISCTGVDHLYITVTNLSVTDGLIVQSVTVPTDLLYCTAELNWSNLYSYRKEHINQFNTTQLYYIQLFPVSNGLEYSCIYRQYSTLWGCGLRVNEQSSSIPSSTSTRGAVADLCPGNLNVTTYYYITSDNTSGHVIDHVTVSITGTKCTTALATPSSSPGASTPFGTDITAVIVVQVLVLVIAVVSAVVSVAVCVVLKKRKKRRELVVTYGVVATDSSEGTESLPKVNEVPVPNHETNDVLLTTSTVTDDVTDEEMLNDEKMGGSYAVPESLPSNEMAQEILVTGRYSRPRSALSFNDEKSTSRSLRNSRTLSLQLVLSHGERGDEEETKRLLSDIEAGGTEIEDTNNVPPQDDDNEYVYNYNSYGNC